jgi:predicted esterase
MNLHSPTSALRFGEPLATAQGAVILLHGRGGSAQDVAGLAKLFDGYKFAFIAPQATGNTWYPQRFFVPTAENEPWLTSALGVVASVVAEARQAGVPADRIGLVGFSQGACLSLEYAARHPLRYGFVAGLSGALIGPAGLARPEIDLSGTPVLLGCAEADPHIPRDYVEQSADILERFGAQVNLHIFGGSAHIIVGEEMEWLKDQAAKLAAG